MKGDIKHKLKFIIRFNKHKITLSDCFSVSNCLLSISPLYSLAPSGSPHWSGTATENSIGFQQAKPLNVMPCCATARMDWPQQKNKTVILFYWKVFVNWQFYNVYIFIQTDTTQALSIKEFCKNTACMWTGCSVFIAFSKVSNTNGTHYEKTVQP